jgi:DNA-binding CsgD family transcriptional regulator
MPAELDIIRAIEAVYDRAADDTAWLEGVARVVAPAFGTGAIATTSYVFDMVPNPSDHVQAFASVGPQPFTREQFRALQATATPEELRSSYECDMFTTLSRVVGQRRTTEGVQGSGMVPKGTMEPLGLRANLTPERGVIVTTLVPWGFRIRHRTLWVRLAAHIGAGLRLREANAARAEKGPDGAAAILTPTGKLEHVTPSTEAARPQLADAAKSIDRARGKLRRVDPDEASALWRAMVRGEWSLVDWFDHDGKRFLLAHENPVTPERTPKLSPREHQVVACAAMGHSNKLIAYDLGLATGTVAVLLARAAKKLGVSTRTELVRAFRDTLPPSPR